MLRNIGIISVVSTVKASGTGVVCASGFIGAAGVFGATGVISRFDRTHNDKLVAFDNPALLTGII